MRAKPPSPVALQPRATAGHLVRLSRGRLHPALIGAVLPAAFSTLASAYTVTLDPAAPTAIYLQVGVGGFTADYCGGTTNPAPHNPPNCGPNYGGGTPENNATINLVSGTVASGSVGNGTAVAMTTNSTVTNSYLDGYVFCSVPAQLYIGGFYRTTGATTAPASVTATVPVASVNAAGDSIPFSQIRWTSSGNGDTGAEPFPAGTFVSGGVQTVGSMASNSWNESCLTFSYLNSSVRAAGTYTGAVLYTMSAP
jgi:hypothetical protein